MPEYIYTGDGKWYAIINGKRRLIVKGDRFTAQDYEIIDTVKSKVTLLSPPEEDNGSGLAGDEDAGSCKAIHRGFGRYDIVNTTSGKKLNSRFLSKSDAERFLDSSTDMA